jgi:hypothetical protein
VTIKRVRAGNIYRPVDDDDSDIVLYYGELGIDADAGVAKVGDGTSPWSALDPALSSDAGGAPEAIDGGTP